MANNGFVVINGKRYRTARRTFTPRLSRAKHKQVNATLGGTVVSQDFGYTWMRWRMTILVELDPEDTAYGSRANLEAAYDQSFVNFVDPFGVNQGNIVFEGDMDLPLAYALVDEAVPFEVEINLRQVQ